MLIHRAEVRPIKIIEEVVAAGIHPSRQPTFVAVRTEMSDVFLLSYDELLGIGNWDSSLPFYKHTWKLYVTVLEIIMSKSLIW